MDLSRAFNTRNHELLLAKLKDCGFSINAWKVLCIYLKKPNDNQRKSITITAQKMKFSSVMWLNPQESQVFLKISLRMSIITSLISERSSFLYFYLLKIFTAPKMKFFIKDFFSKYDQICRKLSGTAEILNGKLYSLSSRRTQTLLKSYFSMGVLLKIYSIFSFRNTIS